MISCDTHVIRKALRLSLNEMAVLCDVYQMSQNPKYGYWCVKSKDKMAEWLDLSRDTVFRAIKTLKDKGYIISNKEGNLRCTQFIYDLESAQEEIAIYIKSGETEVISAKMQELQQSEIHTPSDFATIPSENRTTDSLKIILQPSENRTLDSNKIVNEINNRDIDEILKLEFDKFRKMYIGLGKKGIDFEWVNFKKKYKKYAEIVPMLVPSYEKYLKFREQKIAKGEFVAQPKNFSTYINNACWEEEYDVSSNVVVPDMEKYRNIRGFKEVIHKSGMYRAEIKVDEEGTNYITYIPNGFSS